MQTKLFKLVSALVLLLLVILFSLGWGIIHKIQLDRNSQQLAVTVTESLFTSWSAQAILEQQHVSLKEQITDSMWDNYIDSLQKLGQLESLLSISGQTNVPLLPFVQIEPTARYVVQLQFENGPAQVTIDLIYEENKWQIKSYIVSSFLTDA